MVMTERVKQALPCSVISNGTRNVCFAYSDRWNIRKWAFCIPRSYPLSNPASWRNYKLYGGDSTIYLTEVTLFSSPEAQSLTRWPRNRWSKLYSKKVAQSTLQTMKQHFLRHQQRCPRGLLEIGLCCSYYTGKYGSTLGTERHCSLPVHRFVLGFADWAAYYCFIYKLISSTITCIKWGC
jgi:hypothetical protein